MVWIVGTAGVSHSPILPWSLPLVTNRPAEQNGRILDGGGLNFAGRPAVWLVTV